MLRASICHSPPSPQDVCDVHFAIEQAFIIVSGMADSVLKVTINRILSRKKIELSAQERDLLLAATEHPTALKLLTNDAFNRGSSKDAVHFASKAFASFPNKETEENLIACLVQANQIKTAIDLCMRQTSKLAPIRRATLLSELHARSETFEQSREWGLRALALKDQSIAEITKRAKPVLHAFDPSRPEKNVISFSLFGNDPKPYTSAIRNSIVARNLFPGWTPRFYVDDNMPDTVAKALRNEGAQLRRVSGLPSDRFGWFWRFLVEDDPEVDVYLVRDAAAPLTLKERSATADWLSSRKPFHVMRDSAAHADLMLAGLWGAHRGNLGGMTKRVQRFVKAAPESSPQSLQNLLFVEQELWPLVRGRMCCHDSFFGFGETHQFDPAFALPRGQHIGGVQSAGRKTQ